MTTRDNTGILSRNDQKDVENPEHEKWADFRGDVMIDGKRYFISAWIKESTKDRKRKFFSLAFKPFRPRQENAKAT